MANFMPFISMGWFTSACTTSVLIQQGSWDLVIHRQWECIAPSSVVLSSLQSRYQQAQCLGRTVPWTLCLSTADRIKGKTPSTAYMRSPLYYDLIAARGPTSSYDHIGNWVFFFIVCMCECVWGVGKGYILHMLVEVRWQLMELILSFNLYMRSEVWTQSPQICLIDPTI